MLSPWQGEVCHLSLVSNMLSQHEQHDLARCGNCLHERAKRQPASAGVRNLLRHHLASSSWCKHLHPGLGVTSSPGTHQVKTANLDIDSWESKERTAWVTTGTNLNTSKTEKQSVKNRGGGLPVWKRLMKKWEIEFCSSNRGLLLSWQMRQ